MTFEFHWKNKEANFGTPAEKEIDGGMHFTIEILLARGKKFLMVRRPRGYPGHQLPPKADKYPNGCLYFCHDLPRYGETLEQAVKRIVRSQTGSKVKSIKVLDLTMETYPDTLHEGNRQWAITLYVKAEVSKPKITKDVNEIVAFDSRSIPKDMGWWEPNELRDFLKAGYSARHNILD